MSTGNVIGGHKATISNPNTSQEAKEHSRQVVQELEGQATESTYSSRQRRSVVDVDDEEEGATVEADRGNVLGGNAYHEGVLGDTAPAVSDDTFAGKDPSRVLGGYKATLSNPNTSEEAKEHARSELEQHGVSVE